MADVGIEQLKEDIQSNINTNNNQEITGAVLQGQLIDTVDTLKGYTDDHVSVSQNTLIIGGEYKGELYGQNVVDFEYISAHLDSNGNILWAITKSGDIYYGVGVPSQVRNALEHKVDKETGKSLIDDRYVQETTDFEYIHAHLDSNGNILWAITKSGDIFYGAGVPSQIRKMIDDLVETRALLFRKRISIIGDSISTFDEEGYKIDGYSMYYPENSETVKYVYDTWWKQFIDRTESLLEVNASYSGSGVTNDVISLYDRVAVIGNPNLIFIELGTNNYYTEIGDIDYDADSYDMTKFAPAYIKGMRELVERHPNATVICLIMAMQDDKAEVIKQIATHYNAAWIDLRQYSYYDGNHTHPDKTAMAGICQEIIDRIVLDNILIDKNLSCEHQEPYNVEDNEYISTDLDANGNIVRGIKKDGSSFIPVGVETDKVKAKHLELTPDGLTEFEQILKDDGFSAGKGDWTDYMSNDGDNPLQLPEPRLGMLNIIGEANLMNLTKENTPGAIEGQTYNIPVELEFYDMAGNYFKKPALISGQGRTSLLFKKKNIAFDWFDSEIDGDAFAVKFGNWVAQDSFHLKGYYSDATRGIDVVGYKLYLQMRKTYDIIDDQPYKYLFAEDFRTNVKGGTGKVNQSFDSGAICTPMGFPCIVFLNGAFWGVFSWQIKKSRDNYQMKKANINNIHLDLDDAQILNGALYWQTFEIRNPKPKKKSDGWELICMDGSKYDGDVPQELIDSTSSEYDSSNLSHVKSAELKTLIENFAETNATLRTMASAQSPDASAIRAFMEEHYQMKYLIDYVIFNNVLYNTDSDGGNAQWTTWDGGTKWNPNPYDLNSSFGLNAHGLVRPLPVSIWTCRDNIYGITKTYFNTEIETRYAELRQKGIIDAKNIFGFFDDWVKRIGVNFFDKEFNKWPGSISYRDSKLNEEYWDRYNWSEYVQLPDYDPNVNYSANREVKIGTTTYISLVDNNQGYAPATSPLYWRRTSWDAEDVYNEGDVRLYGSQVFMRFVAKQTNSGQPPVSGFYDEYYGVYGYFDSIYRIYNWIVGRIEWLDTTLHYSNN